MWLHTPKERHHIGEIKLQGQLRYFSQDDRNYTGSFHLGKLIWDSYNLGKFIQSLQYV
jgi:hypothetical protein